MTTTKSEMIEVKYANLDSRSLSEVLATIGIQVVETQDLTGKVRHVGMGGAAKLKYVSPKTGRTIYILERSAPYAPDAYYTESWQFREDFSAQEAQDFLEDHERNKNAARKAGEKRWGAHYKIMVQYMGNGDWEVTCMEGSMTCRVQKGKAEIVGQTATDPNGGSDDAQ